VREQFPQARVLRWDWDVTRTKGAHEAILSRFVRGQADVLVGTQMIAKGLDLPWVTLVGVITADTALHLPDFRASERTFQLLTQVAGRAGRSILGGKVIIQTYAPQHFCIQAACRHDYEGFYQQELSFRREQGYPPFSRLVRLLFTHASASRCEQESERLQRLLTGQIRRLGLTDVSVIGPAPCFLARVRGKHRWQILLRGPDPTQVLEGLRLALGWQVDVDPVSLL
jgi:primosomal protein N' (replication factor Y)